jgi:hypothetical protein
MIEIRDFSRLNISKLNFRIISRKSKSIPFKRILHIDLKNLSKILILSK